MKKGQDVIYFLTAENLSTARNSPHLEVFLDKGLEVLLLTDPIDEWLTAHLPEFMNKKFSSVMKGELDLDEIEKEEDDKKADKEESDEHTELLKRIKDALGDRVKEVRSTHRLTSSPACLVMEEHDMGRHLQQILKASGQQLPDIKPILEINTKHPLLSILEQKLSDEKFEDWSHILFDQALLSEGGKLEDPAGFVKRLNTIFMEMGETRSQAQ